MVDDDCPIIALDRFIQATRDSGYKGTASAVSELIDNSLQAKATRVEIVIREVDGSEQLEVSVLDNGVGMDPFTLRQALRFGGSSRFGDRSGLGRYGMGLPNSSLSQCKRVVVHTWQSARRGGSDAPAEVVYTSYLDVDEIAAGRLQHVPRPKVAKAPPEACRGGHGTLVTWERCDRLDNRRVATLERKLAAELGRRFRHFIWGGARISINGTRLDGLDPLFLTGKSAGASAFGEESRYEIAIDPTDPARGSSTITVRFSELPVHEWGRLPNDEKARRGISKGAGISLVRAGREVDHGWFFMGEKRRENYDDWWRCEIQFEPALDEAFGITHTKQQVRPQSYLLEAISADLEENARALNARVRKAHLALKDSDKHEEAANVANDRDHLLKPLPAKPSEGSRAAMNDLKRQVPALRSGKGGDDKNRPYAIVESPSRQAELFTFGREKGRLVLAWNQNHPFFARYYRPLLDSDAPRDKELRVALDLLLMSAARAEAAFAGRNAEVLAKFRLEWSNTLTTFLKG